MLWTIISELQCMEDLYQKLVDQDFANSDEGKEFAKFQEVVA